MYAGVCRQCRGDHLKTVGSEEVDSNLHSEPQIHKLSMSAGYAEEIVEPPQLLPATKESDQLSAAPVFHVRFQEDLISEVNSSSAVCE